MKPGLRVLEYDFEKLPNIPFSIYFIDKFGEVKIRKMFTVTKKQKNYSDMVVEIYISELKRFVTYNPKEIRVVNNYVLN